ncbi:MAG: thioredoxin family protein [Candidatus Kapaibacterium sp.]
MRTFLTLVAAIILSVSAYAGGGYQVGDVAADFSLKNIDGTDLGMASRSDVKGYIVVFTCNHCPYSVAYEDRIIGLHNTFAPKGYPVIAINPNDTNIVPDDSYANMITRAAEKKFPFPYLIDPTQQTAKAFGATRTPHVFVVEKQSKGHVVRYIGAIDDNAESAEQAKKHYVADAVHALLSGAAPSPETVKAVGCGIKWTKK